MCCWNVMPLSGCRSVNLKFVSTWKSLRVFSCADLRAASVCSPMSGSGTLILGTEAFREAEAFFDAGFPAPVRRRPPAARSARTAKRDQSFFIVDLLEK